MQRAPAPRGAQMVGSETSTDTLRPPHGKLSDPDEDLRNTISARTIQGETFSDVLPDGGTPPRDAPDTFAPSDVVEPSINLDRYTDFLNRIEEKQENLRDARDELIGARFRLQAQRQELLEIREKAGTQGGAAFNLIRQYLLSKNGPGLPAEIEAALARADNTRNALGTREVEYEEAERAYNLLEWGYTEKEHHFISNLPEFPPAPGPPDQPFPSFNDDQDYGSLLYSAHEIATIVAESENAPPTVLYTTDLSPEYGEEYSEEQSTQSTETLRYCRERDAQGPTPRHAFEGDPAGMLIFEELTIGDPRQKWSTTRKRIDDWLLHSLESSVYEKGQLRAHMASKSVGYPDWWQDVRQQWFQTSSPDNEFHTGDTTISHESSHDAPVLDATQNTPDMFHIAEHAAWDPSGTPDPVLERFPSTPPKPETGKISATSPQSIKTPFQSPETRSKSIEYTSPPSRIPRSTRLLSRIPQLEDTVTRNASKESPRIWHGDEIPTTSASVSTPLIADRSAHAQNVPGPSSSTEPRGKRGHSPKSSESPFVFPKPRPKSKNYTNYPHETSL